MVVMAVLGSPHFCFKTQHLLAVLAERAIHGGVAADHLSHPLHEGVDHQGVITEVAGLQEFHLGVISGHALAVLANTAHQHP